MSHVLYCTPLPTNLWKIVHWMHLNLESGVYSSQGQEEDPFPLGGTTLCASSVEDVHKDLSAFIPFFLGALHCSGISVLGGDEDGVILRLF